MKVLKSFIITLLIFLFVVGTLFLLSLYPIGAFSIILLLLFLSLWSDLYDSM